MTIPGTLEVRGWFITDHAVQNFKLRYGWEGKLDQEVREHVGNLLNATRPECIYSFYAEKNGTNLEIYHVEDYTVHSYFLIDPDRRPPAVVTVYTIAQFRNFWNSLLPKHKFKGPECELSVEKCMNELTEKNETIEVLTKNLEKEKKRNVECGKILHAIDVLSDFLFRKKNLDGREDR